MENNGDFEIVDGVLVKYKGAGGDVVLPESVTAIGRAAFNNCASLVSVTIPEGVSKIGEYAFQGCKSLVSVTIPESVTAIGDRAFLGCILADDFKIEAAGWRFENSFALKDGVFKYCTNSNVTGITIPEGVSKIGEYAFQGCKSLVSVTIPESVTEIGRGAFNGCSSLKSLEIPSAANCADGAFPETCKVTRV